MYEYKLDKRSKACAMENGTVFGDSASALFALDIQWVEELFEICLRQK